MPRRSRFARSSTLYFDENAQTVIVTVNGNFDGATVELSASVLSDGDHLGNSVLEALGASRAVQSLREPEGWAGYEASGERTKRTFEERWTPIYVRGANNHNVTWLVDGPRLGEYGLHLQASVAPTADGERLERAIRLVLDESRRRGLAAE